MEKVSMENFRFLVTRPIPTRQGYTLLRIAAIFFSFICNRGAMKTGNEKNLFLKKNLRVKDNKGKIEEK